MNILHLEYTDIPKPSDRKGVEPRVLLGDTAHIIVSDRMVCGFLVDKACTRQSHSIHTKYLFEETWKTIKVFQQAIRKNLILTKLLRYLS